VAAVIALAVMTGLAGWALHDAAGRGKPVTVQRTFTATVTLLNSERSAGCVANARHRACGVFYVDPSHPLQRGQRVHVAIELASLGDEKFDLLVVYSADS
jgi:hypothetical protein